MTEPTFWGVETAFLDEIREEIATSDPKLYVEDAIPAEPLPFLRKDRDAQLEKDMSVLTNELTLHLESDQGVIAGHELTRNRPRSRHR